ncbi:branched-chain amino acid transaminase [bacterium]|jgi:branched-chain amino acid aminotransferase|nr:branched-chain amino acid transaminase [bacterium]
MNPVPYIWKNGAFIDWESATTHVLTHALHYSTAVFEGVRAYHTDKGPAIFRAKEHYERLIESGKMYYLESPYSVDDWVNATIELIEKNALDSCYIRPIIYAGYGAMGILPTANPVESVLAAWEWGAYLGEEGLEKGIRCTISPWEKFSSKAMPATAKCTANYANSVLAKQEAVNRGFDEAILLNSNGTISEGPGENIFCIKDGKITTPPVEDDALRGITCDTVIQLIEDMGIPIERKTLTKAEMLAADELFFTGTAAEVTPIREIDQFIIGSGARGPISERIQTKYFDVVNGRDEKYTHWLTYTKG